MSNWLAFIDDSAHIGVKERKAFLAHVQSLKGQEVVLSLRKRPKRQGTQSLRYLRGVVIPDIAKACGYTDPDDYQAVYDGLMWKFRRLPDGPFGEPRRMSCAKDKMDQEAISELTSEIITYAETSIPGCRVRRPNEQELDDVLDHPEWEEAS